MLIEALTPLNRISCKIMYEDITRSRLFHRIAMRSIASSKCSLITSTVHLQIGRLFEFTDVSDRTFKIFCIFVFSLVYDSYILRNSNNFIVILLCLRFSNLNFAENRTLRN